MRTLFFSSYTWDTSQGNCVGIMLCIHHLNIMELSLRKHAYSNILKISPPNIESFLDKNSDISH